jgi:hypothetical protein
MTRELAVQCRELVFKTAKEYDVPSVYITAHIRLPAADEARKHVWRVMIRDMGMTRQMVADCFGRDRRRLRKSVIGV